MALIAEAIEASKADPSVRHVVSLSGGKDSSALAIFMKAQHPELKVEYIFCDTGAELPETYDYLDRLEAYLGQEIVRLSALDLLGIAKKGNRNAFDIWLNEVYGGYLPNPRSRWCTRVLKIEPFEKFIGTGTAYSYIGIRADENRDGYSSKKTPVLSHKPNIIPVYPFREHKISLDQVTKILEDSGLGYPTYYEWRSRSGCYFCFYQQMGEWQGLIENHRDLFEKAKSYEKFVGNKKYTWVEGKSLNDIEKIEQRYDVKRPNDADGCAICHL